MKSLLDHWGVFIRKPPKNLTNGRRAWWRLVFIPQVSQTTESALVLGISLLRNLS